MKAKKLISLGLVAVLSIGILVGCSSSDKKSDTKEESKNSKTKIGILQIAEHNALDSAREGFEKALEEKGYKDKVEIEFKNAQGETSTANTIAKKFVEDDKDLLFGIATPAAQALYNAAEEKQTPIVITAVTDPVAAKLVKSMNKPGKNVTGTSDKVDMSEQIALIKEILPEAKKLGFIYNTSEANSEVQLKDMEKIAKDKGFELEKVGITSTNEVSQGVETLLTKVDVIYTPTDNTIASSMSLITEKATAKQIPVIGSEKAHVENGALATKGIDYEKLGYQTGLMAIEIIKGKKPADMPIQTIKKLDTIVNEEAATKLGITLPEDLIKNSEVIGSGSSDK